MISHSERINRIRARSRTLINQGSLHRIAWKMTAATLFSLAAGAVAHAELATIAYEGFDYSEGSLAGKNGGTGWTSAWIQDYLSGGSLGVSETGISYSGLSVTGGSAIWSFGGNGISEDMRSLPLLNSGVVYFQFVGQFGSGSGGGTPNIRLLNSGAVTGGFGGNGGAVAERCSGAAKAASSSVGLVHGNCAPFWRMCKKF